MDQITVLVRGLRSTLALAVPITLAACGGGAGGARPTAMAEPIRMAEPTPMQQRVEAQVSDAEVAAFVAAANRGELQQGELAAERAQDPAVRAFATQMVEEHGAALREQEGILIRSGITPRSNELSRQVEANGALALETLQGLSGQEFDRAYMDIQLKQHRQLLTALDAELIPNVQDPQLRAFLQQRRGDVAQHLAHAEDLRGQAIG